jgi:hypothetical protein
LIEVKIESACGAEIRRFHGSTIPYEFSPLQFYTSEPLIPQRPLMKSPTRGAVQGPRKN